MHRKFLTILFLALSGCAAKQVAPQITSCIVSVPPTAISLNEIKLACTYAGGLQANLDGTTLDTMVAIPYKDFLKYLEYVKSKD